MALALKERLARQAAGESHLAFDPTGRDEPRLATLPLALIDPDPNQPRKHLGDVADLASSIREQGLINPLVVEVVAGGRYRLITGERRFAACRSLGLTTAPCIVRTVAEHARLAMQIIENIHRKDLHPVEEARAFKRLMDEFNLTQRDLAARVGKSVAAINQTLRILDLEPGLLAVVQTSEHATKSVLLEIAKEADPTRREMLWQQAQAGELTVQRARLAKQNGSRKTPKKARSVIELPEATVAVKFRSGEATGDRVCEALELALSNQRSQV
jgi:ParB family chromosome partitioning protein